MTTAPSILATGYIALDVIQAPEGTWLRAGGTAANVAAILAYLGWRSGVVGVLGDDDAGPLVQVDLEQAGVDVTGLTLRHGVGTPLVLHEIRASGHRFQFGCIACGRVYRRHRPINKQEMARVVEDGASADVFFFDRPTAPALAMAELHSQAGRLVVYEPASTGRAEGHRRAASLADVIKFSQERSPLFIDSLPEPNERQLWITTAGAEGSRVRLGRGEWHSIAAPQVSAVDAGGAGDWMTARILAELVPNRPVTQDALDALIATAQAVAAVSCLVPGARTLTDVLTPSELEEEARRVASGHLPRLAFEPSGQPPSEENCPRCRLPIAELVGRAS